MRTLQEKVEGIYQLDRDGRLFLDIALAEIRGRAAKKDKFIAVNEFTRRRFKTTALLIYAIENKMDVFVQTSLHKGYMEQALDRIRQEAELEYVPRVHVLSVNARGLESENGFVTDELWKVDREALEAFLYQIHIGFMEQSLFAGLHKEGLL